MKKRKEMSDTAVCNTYGKNAKALIDAIKKLSETQGLDTVFTTFLELTAVCLRACLLYTSLNAFLSETHRYGDCGIVC